MAFRYSGYSGLTHKNVKLKAKSTVHISQIFPFEYWWIFVRQRGSSILYRVGEERFWFVASHSTYIAREPQWLSLRPNRDPPTQKKKNKRPFSRPANKTNKEIDTNILVLLFNRCFVFSMQRSAEGIE